MKRNSAWVIASVTAFIGCSQPLEKQDLISYISDPENGVVFEQKDGGLHWKAQFIPTAIMIANLTKNGVSAEETGFDFSDYDNTLFFAIEISDDGHELYDRYRQNATGSRLFDDLAFGLKRLVSLETSSGKKMIPEFCYSPVTYGLAGTTRILAGFRAEISDREDWLRLKIDGLGVSVTGTRYFKFQTSDIRNVPPLKTT